MFRSVQFEPGPSVQLDAENTQPPEETEHGATTPAAKRAQQDQLTSSLFTSPAGDGRSYLKLSHQRVFTLTLMMAMFEIYDKRALAFQYMA